ncbi:MAG: hypothetical protein H6715_06200 [Myxococcales bacterium]|nr:hypothetical protein [Myxococcales bacterium]
MPDTETNYKGRYADDDRTQDKTEELELRPHDEHVPIPDDFADFADLERGCFRRSKPSMSDERNRWRFVEDLRARATVIGIFSQRDPATDDPMQRRFCLVGVVARP